MKTVIVEQTNMVAAIVNCIVPGLGHLVAGKIFKAILWFSFCAAGYMCFIVPGVVLHLCCIWDGSRIKNQVIQVVKE